jgi:hypothetical protein
MISVRVYVHWRNSHAFTGVVNARHARVTKLAHRHIKMTGKAWPAQVACRHCSTLQYNSHTYTGHGGR